MSRPVAKLLIEGALTAVTPDGTAPQAGPALGRIRRFAAPAVAAADGRILWIGPATDLRDHVATTQRTMRIDATACSLVPGFVDAAPPPSPGGPDPALDWALARGTTTLAAASTRREGFELLAPVDVLLRSGASLDAQREAVRALAGGPRPLALTATTPTGAGVQVASMPYALAVACLGLGLSFGEALAAATLNAAASLGHGDDRGGLETGRRLDVAIVEGPPERLVAAGAAAVRMVIREGRLVTWA